jgi:hypothetical protein
MTIDELKALETKQYAEYRRIENVSKEAARLWLETRQQIERLEQQAEIERLVQERLAQVTP